MFIRCALKSDFEFQCSLSWIRGFCVRHCLTYSEATHQLQQKLRDPDYELDTLKAFILGFAKYAKVYRKCLIFNMGENPGILTC